MPISAPTSDPLEPALGQPRYWSRAITGVRSRARPAASARWLRWDPAPFDQKPTSQPGWRGRRNGAKRPHGLAREAGLRRACRFTGAADGDPHRPATRSITTPKSRPALGRAGGVGVFVSGGGSLPGTTPLMGTRSSSAGCQKTGLFARLPWDATGEPGLLRSDRRLRADGRLSTHHAEADRGHGDVREVGRGVGHRAHRPG